MTLVLTLILTSLLLVAALWKLPQLQVRHLKGLRPEEIFDRTNEARKTIAQILGGAILLGGFYFNWRGQNETAKDNAETQRIARDQQVTEGFTRAIEQLGGGTLEVKLGGIFGLERLSQEPAMNHWTVMEVLTAYVRTHAPLQAPVQPLTWRPRPPTDIQAVLTVLGRRKYQKVDSWLDLRGTNLAGSDLNGADLAWADVAGSDLQYVDLSGASLKGAYLKQTHLENANLDGTCLNQADLRQTYFTLAGLRKAWWDSTTTFAVSVNVGNPSIHEPDRCK